MSDEEKPGYHLAKIRKGELGEVSKIREELEELEDAETQRCKILQLVEVSDLLGAIAAYLQKHHPNTTLQDAVDMARITERAFKNGRRG